MSDEEIRKELLLDNKVDCPKITNGYENFGRSINKSEFNNERQKILKDTLDDFVRIDSSGISNLEKYTEQSINNVVEWSKKKHL